MEKRYGSPPPPLQPWCWGGRGEGGGTSALSSIQQRWAGDMLYVCYLCRYMKTRQMNPFTHTHTLAQVPASLWRRRGIFPSSSSWSNRLQMWQQQQPAAAGRLQRPWHEGRPAAGRLALGSVCPSGAACPWTKALPPAPSPGLQRRSLLLFFRVVFPTPGTKELL